MSKHRADICEGTSILLQKKNDSSRLAEEKEEDGGQRRPEKRKEPLGKTAPHPPIWRGGEYSVGYRCDAYYIPPIIPGGIPPPIPGGIPPGPPGPGPGELPPFEAKTSSTLRIIVTASTADLITWVFTRSGSTTSIFSISLAFPVLVLTPNQRF